MNEEMQQIFIKLMNHITALYGNTNVYFDDGKTDKRKQVMNSDIELIELELKRLKTLNSNL